MADDCGFGFLVTPLTDTGMFRFQLIVDGQLIGDSEPCLLGTAMAELGDLPHLDDERLGRLATDQDVVLSLLLTEEEFHDRTTMSLAESLDMWLVHGFFHGADMVFIARACVDGSPVKEALISVMASVEYDTLFEAARDYWSKCNGLAE